MRKVIHIAAGADPELTEYFSSLGFETDRVSTAGIVAEPVSDHPDMFMCKLGVRDGSKVISWFAPSDEGGGRPQLSAAYPLDIPFNAACTGIYLVHNLRYTAPVLLEAARDAGMELVNVRQGYAKCSTVTVDENSVITYDRGIAAACRAAGMYVLETVPGHVLLPGYDTGFIGGASGRAGDTIYFNGDLTRHPDCDAIVRFIEERGLRVSWFEGRPLTDIGSIITEVTD